MPNRLSATRQIALIRSGEVAARELLEAHIEEIDSRNGLINAFLCVDAEGARSVADRMDQLALQGDFAGPLHGVVVGIKDNAAVARLPCTYGCRAFQHNIPTHDAAHVANLRDAGAIILGKTNMPEFGHGRFGGQTHNALAGLTRNPWNPECTVSSSSGGAAAALAAHFVALADGSDIAGSIRGPAAWCGLYGLRPTPGIVPSWPKSDPLDGIDVFGPMARTADDLSLMFDALRGPRAAPLHDVPDPIDVRGSVLEGLRVAWCMNPAGSNPRNEVLEAISHLKVILTDAGAIVEDAVPDLTGLHAAQAVLRSFGVLRKLGPEIEARPDQFSAELRQALMHGKSLSVNQLAVANRDRDRAVNTMAAFFRRYDVLAWPTSTGLPFPAEAETGGITEDWTPIELTPALQLPALAIPVGKTPDGMPCGIQLIGPWRSDLNLIQMARTLEPKIGFIGRDAGA